MAITLTTSPQIVGRNEGSTIKTYLYAWYDSQSGNTCSVHTRLTCVSSGITYTGTNKSYFMKIGGYDSGVQEWKYAPLNANQEYTVSEAAWTYSGGEQIYAAAGFWSYVYGSADVGLADAVYVPVFNSPPTGLSVSVAETYTNGAKFNVSLDSYGIPSGNSGRYIEAGIMNHGAPYGGPYKYNFAYNTNSAQITVNNSSSGAGGLTIQPNTRYYFGGYAHNTAMSTSVVSGQFTTRPLGPTVAFASSTTTSANFTYSVTADGGQYQRSVQYSLDNGSTWKTVATIINGASSTGTFTLNGLPSGAAYTMKTRISTQAGATNGNEVPFYTLIDVENKENKFYGSDGERARKISALYSRVERRVLAELTGEIRPRTSGSPNITAFDPSVFLAKVRTDTTRTVEALQLWTVYSGGVYTGDLNLYYTNGVGPTLVSGASASDLATYGLTVDFSIYGSGSDFIDLAPTYTTVGETKLLSKLYGASAQHINTTYFIAVDEEKFIQAMHDRSSVVPLDALSTNPYVTLERTAQDAWRVYLRQRTGGAYYYTQFSTFASFASAFEEAFTWAQSGQILLETALSEVAAVEDLFNSSVAALVYQGFGHLDYT